MGMRILIGPAAIVASLLASGAAFALPPCPIERNKPHHACFGTYEDPSGDRYVGEFQNNNYNGQGTYYAANGDRYVGGFLNGEYHGTGTYYYINGDIYRGGFKKSLFHGWGVYTWANGKKEAGEYEFDKLVRKVTINIALK
jgi:hypothetical protein